MLTFHSTTCRMAGWLISSEQSRCYQFFVYGVANSIDEVFTLKCAEMKFLYLYEKVNTDRVKIGKKSVNVNG